MENEREIVNKVASSGLVTFDLEEFYVDGPRVLIDLKDQLFQGMILREKDLRDFVRNHDWSFYKDKFVAVTCSEDVVIPTWAYMLITSSLQPFARKIIFGTLDDLENKIFSETLSTIDWSKFDGQKIVIKGCSKVAVPLSAYVEVTNYLRPFASSIMFGEPCSTVPVYKKPKAA